MTLRPTSITRILAIGTFVTLAVLSASSHAEKADRTKPMNIEADSLRYDDLKQTSVFTGNVVVTKGTIILRGARIDVRQDPEGFQYGVVTAAPGKLAYFKQKRDAPGPGDEYIEGESELIEYDSRADQVKFIRRAVMRRLLGATVNDETVGPLIVYDQSNDTFTVNGAPMPPNGSVATGEPGSRVRAVLTPKPSPNAAAAANAAAAVAVGGRAAVAASAAASGAARPSGASSAAAASSSSSSSAASPARAPASAASAASPATVPTPLRRSTTLGGEPRQ